MTVGFTPEGVYDLPPADLVRDDRVAGRMYTDPEIFDLEMTRIVERTWVWVAHESELPKAGSFKSTKVGRQPVIVTRDRKGVIHTLLNRCRHRGASVCEQRSVNANGFTCPYHAWSYGLDGTLRGIPYPDGYEGVMTKEGMGLKKLRTESYGGTIFATLAADADALDEFLGDFKLWIDRIFKQGGGYPVKVLGTHRFKFRGNWKIQLENTTDGYHFPIVHRSWMVSLDEETSGMMSFMTDSAAITHDLGNGHSVMQKVPEHSDLDGSERLQARVNDLVGGAESDRPGRLGDQKACPLHARHRVQSEPLPERVDVDLVLPCPPADLGRRNLDRARGSRCGRSGRYRWTCQPRKAASARALRGHLRIRHPGRRSGVGSGAARIGRWARTADHGPPWPRTRDAVA